MRSLRCAAVLLLAGLSGCNLLNPEPNSVDVGGYCRETEQCFDGLVCYNFECIDRLGGGGSSDSGDDDDTATTGTGACTTIGGVCATDLDCCSSVCLAGQQVCGRACTTDAECGSGCCQALGRGNLGCYEAALCP